MNDPANNKPPESETQADTGTHPARRLAGIAALLTCALVFDPARVLPEAYAFTDINQQLALHAVLIPLLAAAGMWLVLPNTLVLAICTLMLSIAHAHPGSDDLFAGYLYPCVALVAGSTVVYTLFIRHSRQ